MVGDTLLLLVVRSSPAQADTHHIKLAGPVLLPTLLPLAVALGERPKAGARADAADVRSRSRWRRATCTSACRRRACSSCRTAACSIAARARWMGARPDTVRAWRIATDSASGRTGFTGWVDEQGRIVLATQLLGMSLERRPYEVAFENWKADVAKRGKRGVAGPRHLRDDGDRGEQAAARRTSARCACG